MVSKSSQDSQPPCKRQFYGSADPRRYLIAVDTSEYVRKKLIGKIVVASNKKTKQLVVSRLVKFDHTEVLVADQRENRSVLLANESEWNIVVVGW